MEKTQVWKTLIGTALSGALVGTLMTGCTHTGDGADHSCGGKDGCKGEDKAAGKDGCNGKDGCGAADGAAAPAKEEMKAAPAAPAKKEEKKSKKK